MILERNPGAFDTGQKGCNCRNTGCLKNYCVCYANQKPCTNLCNCGGCQNRPK